VLKLHVATAQLITDVACCGMPLPVTLRTVITVVLFLAVGCTFYVLVDEKTCEDEETDEDCTEHLTFIDALYFCMVTMSTVGYGDFSPTTTGSQVFTCFYIIIGVSVVFSRLASSLSGMLEAFEKRCMSFLDRWDKSADVSGHVKQGFSGREVDIDDDGKADFVEPPPAIVFWLQKVSFSVFILILVQVVSAFGFWALDEMSYGDAFYHCFVTATTVGYGDISLTTQGSRLFAIFHIGVSVAWMAGFTSQFADLAAQRRSQLKRAYLLETPLSWDKVQEYDRDGKGVNKFEFVISMLMDIGVELCGEPMEWADVKPFMVVFDETDVTQTGFLSAADIQMARFKAHSMSSLRRDMANRGINIVGAVSSRLSGKLSKVVPTQ